jgi:hypothetical protein
MGIHILKLPHNISVAIVLEMKVIKEGSTTCADFHQSSAQRIPHP